MKSDIRTFILPAGAVFRDGLWSQRNQMGSNLSFASRQPSVSAAGADRPRPQLRRGGLLHRGEQRLRQCGTTFVARNFSLPGEGKCTPWSGYTKTADTVILTTSGTSSLSSDSKALTVSVSSADPEDVGPGQLVPDYIQLSRGDATEPFTGQDTGEFAGSAEPVSCTSDLLTLPSYHN
jgi:hypothetical protein